MNSSTFSKSTIILILILWGNEIMRFARAVVLHISGLRELADFFIPFCIIIALCFALRDITRRLKIVDIVFYLLVVSVYLLNYLFYPENSNGLDEYSSTFLLSVLPFYFVGIILDFEQLEKPMYYVSVGCIICSAFYYLFFVQSSGYSGSAEIKADNMSSSYAVLAHVIFVVWETIKKPSMINVFTSIFGVFLILSFGTRGPLVCLLVFVALYLVILRSYKHPILTRLLIIAVTILLISFINPIVLGLSYLASNFGMSTRIFDQFINDMFFESVGRNEIYDIVYSKIIEKQGGAYGIACDYNFTDETYTHNIILQLLLEFGVVFGSIISFVLLFVLFQGLKNAISENDRAFMLLLFVCGFVHLCLSHNYFTSTFLFFSLGFAVSQNRKLKI